MSIDRLDFDNLSETTFGNSLNFRFRKAFRSNTNATFMANRTSKRKSYSRTYPVSPMRSVVTSSSALARNRVFPLPLAALMPIQMKAFVG